jgi:hypothetical protein
VLLMVGSARVVVETPILRGLSDKVEVLWSSGMVFRSIRDETKAVSFSLIGVQNVVLGKAD